MSAHDEIERRLRAAVAERDDQAAPSRPRSDTGGPGRGGRASAAGRGARGRRNRLLVALATLAVVGGGVGAAVATTDHSPRSRGTGPEPPRPRLSRAQEMRVAFIAGAAHRRVGRTGPCRRLPRRATRFVATPTSATWTARYELLRRAQRPGDRAARTRRLLRDRVSGSNGAVIRVPSMRDVRRGGIRFVVAQVSEGSWDEPMVDPARCLQVMSAELDRLIARRRAPAAIAQAARRYLPSGEVPLGPSRTELWLHWQRPGGSGGGRSFAPGQRNVAAISASTGIGGALDSVVVFARDGATHVELDARRRDGSRLHRRVRIVDNVAGMVVAPRGRQRAARRIVSWRVVVRDARGHARRTERHRWPR